MYETDANGQFISFTNESVWAKDFTEVTILPFQGNVIAKIGDIIILNGKVIKDG